MFTQVLASRLSSSRLVSSADNTVKRIVDRERSMDRQIGPVSRMIWPWQDRWLVPLVGLLAALDLISTYVLLELSGKTNLYEGGLLAAKALRWGGFDGLYIMNVACVGLLCIIACTARYCYARYGLEGFARTAYVVMLVPYAIVAFAAVVNNSLMVAI